MYDTREENISSFREDYSLITKFLREQRTRKEQNRVPFLLFSTSRKWETFLLLVKLNNEVLSWGGRAERFRFVEKFFLPPSTCGQKFSQSVACANDFIFTRFLLHKLWNNTPIFITGYILQDACNVITSHNSWIVRGLHGSNFSIFLIFLRSDWFCLWWYRGPNYVWNDFYIYYILIETCFIWQ